MASPISFKPRSLLQLVLTGFVLVSGVLLIALSITIRQFDVISESSQQTVTRALTGLAASRDLQEQTTALERNASQYAIVGGQNILTIYEERRSAFLRAATRLEQLGLSDEFSALLIDARQTEEEAYQAIRSGNTANLSQTFARLSGITTSLSNAVTGWTSQLQDTIENETSVSQSLVIGQTLLLIASAVVLAILFVLLINRPLAQVRHAIEQLGAGSYERNISVGGPKDLVAVGQQLDWLRERLANLEQQRTMFLRHVSHELKSPLATIQESTALLGDGVVGNLTDAQKELVDIQGKSLKKLHTLIDDLLRQHERNYAIVNTVTSALRLDKLVRKVLSEHSYAIKSSQVQLHLALEKCHFTGNQEQLRVAIDNLVSNALRFSPQGSLLSIDLTNRDDQLVLQVKDQGPGISEQDKERLFDAFYSGKQAGPHPYKGSGLGLAITREYINAHNGQVEVVDQAGPGACFRVTLPLA